MLSLFLHLLSEVMFPEKNRKVFSRFHALDAFGAHLSTCEKRVMASYVSYDKKIRHDFCHTFATTDTFFGSSENSFFVRTLFAKKHVPRTATTNLTLGIKDSVVFNRSIKKAFRIFTCA